MGIITINALQYHYEISGQGQPMLLLHGFTGAGKSWDRVRTLIDDRYTTITVDLIGHGATESPTDAARYQMTYAAADLVSLMQQLGYERFSLWGYSMGGRLALYTAIHYPQAIQSLILESSSPGLESSEARAERIHSDEALAARIEQNGIAAFIEYWEKIPLFASQQRLPAATREALHQQRLRNNTIGLANSLRGMGTGIQPSLWGELNKLTLPVLLMAGELDTKFVEIAKQMHTQITGSTLKIIPSCGHAISFESPESVVEAVLQG